MRAASAIEPMPQYSMTIHVTASEGRAPASLLPSLPAPPSHVSAQFSVGSAGGAPSAPAAAAAAAAATAELADGSADARTGTSK